MYKLKNLSANGVTIKFSKQNEVNFQAVCVLNEARPETLASFSFEIKHFKILAEYRADGFIRLCDLLRSGTDADTVLSIVSSVCDAVSSFSSLKLDMRGLIYRADCIFVSNSGRVKLVYAPSFVFDISNKPEALAREIASLAQMNEAQTGKIYSMLASAGTENGIADSMPADNSFNESGTTVLSPKPGASFAGSYNEGETTVLSAANAPSSAVPGETTLLSPESDSFDDDFNENATRLYDDSLDGDMQNENLTVMLDDNMNGIPDGMPDAQSDEEENYSERETTMPEVGNPLRGERTLIGVDGLAQAMAYSSIRTNESAAENHETVLLSDESFDKTAFFIRFINSQAVYITKNYFTIGSGADMDYMISGNSLISKYHATVVIEDSRFYIIDNNSTNKLYVDGREAVPFEKNEIFTGSRIVLANEIFDFYIK